MTARTRAAASAAAEDEVISQADEAESEAAEEGDETAEYAGEETPAEPVEDRAARIVASLIRLANDKWACRALAVKAALQAGVALSFVDDPVGTIAQEIAAALQPAQIAAYQPYEPAEDEAVEEGSEAEGSADTGDGAGASPDGQVALAETEGATETEAAAEEEAVAYGASLGRVVALLRLYRTIRGGSLDEGELADALVAALSATYADYQEEE